MPKIRIFFLTYCFSICCLAGSAITLEPNVSFQAVHRIGAKIWASGTHGGIYTSQDNGENWQKVNGPINSQQLEFRDIQLLDDGSVVVMSAGDAEASRVYKSDVSKKNWQLQVQGNQAETFYDCMHFTDSQHGWLYGDSDKQGLFVLQTEDGGQHWQRAVVPLVAQKGEGGFASSGTCLISGENRQIYIGTGNAEQARVLNYSNGSWKNIDAPFTGGEAAGVFSLYQAGDFLYAFGGSLKDEQRTAQASLLNLSSNAWTALANVPLKGAIYGASLLGDKNDLKVLIANPQGVAVWHQKTQNWTLISQNNIWSLACDDTYGCIGVGKNGLIEQFNFHQ